MPRCRMNWNLISAVYKSKHTSWHPDAGDQKILGIQTSNSPVTYRPNVRVVPVNNRIDTHELWPALVRRAEVPQSITMGVGPPSAHEYCLDFSFVVQICVKSLSHRQGIAGEVEVVLGGRGRNKFLNLRERVSRDNVYCLKRLGESTGLGHRRFGCRLIISSRGYLRRHQLRQTRQYQDKED